MAARDATTVAPQQYRMEFEDEQVRVVRARYGPGERAALHSHPALVAVLLTDAHIRFTERNGRAEEIRGEAGQVLPLPATTHEVENLADRPFEAVLVEIKG